MYCKKALLYSLDTSVTIGQLKQWNQMDFFDTKELESRMSDHKIDATIVWEDAHFKFVNIKNPPYVIYSQWDIGVLDMPIISIVWPRKISTYHEQVLRDFFENLKHFDVATVSWWAIWVDSLVHTLSIQYKIPTIMVLWAWFRSYLTWSKRHLLRKIMNSWWCILSEFRLWQKAAPRTFPQRNRIIAWIWDVVFLPWATSKSWSLITVDFARNMNIPVYTVPASVYDFDNSGTNDYLSKRYIWCVTDMQIFLERYFVRKEEVIHKIKADYSDIQKDILHQLWTWESTLDLLMRWLSIDTSLLLSELSELELLWAVFESRSGVRASK